MNPVLKRALPWLAALIVLVLGTVGVHHWWQGVTEAHYQAGRAAERAAAQAAHDIQLAAERKQAEQAALRLQQKLTAAQQLTQALKQEARRADLPLVVCSDVRGPDPAGPGDGALASGQAAAALQAASGPVAEPPAPAKRPDGGPGHLTLAGVRLWNSALAGQRMSAGACSADDGTAGACAAASGVSVTDAIDNHVVNAERCAVDRQRMAELIDFLRTRETGR